MQQCAQSRLARVVSAQGPILHRAPSGLSQPYPSWRREESTRPRGCAHLAHTVGTWHLNIPCPNSPKPTSSLLEWVPPRPTLLRVQPLPTSLGLMSGERAAVCRREADRAWVCGNPRVGREGTRAGKRRKRGSEPGTTSWPETLRSWRILNSHLTSILFEGVSVWKVRTCFFYHSMFLP